MRRAVVFLFLVNGCVGCAKAANMSPGSFATSPSVASRSSTNGTATDTGPMEPTSSTTSNGLEELIGVTWIVISSTGTGKDSRGSVAQLRFTDNGHARGTVELFGVCASGTFPVVFEPSHVLEVGPPQGLQVCAAPDDVGQAIPNILELRLRWSIVGHKLTLTPTTPSDYSLVLSKDWKDHYGTSSTSLPSTTAPPQLDILPLELVITPANASPGQTVTVSFLGDLSQASLYGPDAHIDRRIDGGWRPEWYMLNEDFSRSATSIADNGTPTTIPAIGYPLTKDSKSRFVLPIAISKGEYRFCLSATTNRTGARPDRSAADATVSLN